jgi:DNA (cytosine-5)-methyltransferase 1
MFAIEKNKLAFATLEHNLIDKKNTFEWPAWLPQHALNIKTVLKKHENELRSLSGKVDLVTGGPPCQGFSSAGRRRQNDQRNKLIHSYINFIRLVKPRILFFENVKGFTVGFKKKKSRGKAYSEYVLNELKNLGYDVHGEILDFSEFGVPQRRKRFILVGVLKGNAHSFFKMIVDKKDQFLQAKGINEHVTLAEAISDLERKHGEVDSPDTKHFKAGVYSKPVSHYQELLRQELNGDLPDSHRFANHKKETVKKFRYIIAHAPRNKRAGDDIMEELKSSKRDVVLLDHDAVSPTLTTLPDDYIHYSEPRILTVREYARIQSFADWFEFKGKYTTGAKDRRKDVPRYTQVGNAIPPLFGEQAGLTLKELLYVP